MYRELPSILMFMAGITTAAFTNVFTGLEREKLAWRCGAMIAFLVSGVLLFWCAGRAESALRQADRVSRGAGDFAKQFHFEFGRKGWTLVIFAALAVLAAVILLVTATFSQSPPPQP